MSWSMMTGTLLEGVAVSWMGLLKHCLTVNTLLRNVRWLQSEHDEPAVKISSVIAVLSLTMQPYSNIRTYCAKWITGNYFCYAICSTVQVTWSTQCLLINDLLHFKWHKWCGRRDSNPQPLRGTDFLPNYSFHCRHLAFVGWTFSST